MNKSPGIDYFRNKGLLPFQAQFAVTFLADKSKRSWQLVSPVGTGKTRLAGAIIAHELEVSGKKRFLVLCPASLLAQWQSVISEMLLSEKGGVKPLIIDRKTYLEIESCVPVGQNPWPAVAVILMSIDLAKREDMARNLSGVTWDLVIIDESHLLTGKRKNIFERLIKSGAITRALLLTVVLPSHKLENVATKSIKWQDVVDWNGQTFYPSFRKTMITLDFERTKEERGILRDVQQFADELATLKPHGRFQNWILLRAASSSMYAFEESLRRLLESWRIMRNKIAHGIPWTKEDLEAGQKDLILGLDDVEIDEDISGDLTFHSKKFVNLFLKLEALLDGLEEIQIDSKLNCLLSYVKESVQDKGKQYLCIWTSFRNTAEYLMSSLEDLDIPVYVLNGSLNADERSRRLDLFRIDGGILISTDAMLEGVALQFVDEALNYDLPVSPIKLEQRWSRFLRVGRKSEFRMVFMRDRSRAFAWEENLLAKLEGLTKSEKTRKDSD